jgi:hypothetical protein
MSPTSTFAKFLRFVGIFLMSITAGFTILGGVGTSCAALAPKNWDSMAPLASAQWLYILYVLLTTAIGIYGIRAVVQLIRGSKNAYRDALIALIAGVVVGGIHIATSRALRGGSMPVDMVVAITLLTLVVFLLFRIPWVWSGVDYTKAPRKERKAASGGAALLLGGLCLTIQRLMEATHTWDGINYADAFNTTMTVAGMLLLFTGGMLLVGVVLDGKSGKLVEKGSHHILNSKQRV